MGNQAKAVFRAGAGGAVRTGGGRLSRLLVATRLDRVPGLGRAAWRRVGAGAAWVGARLRRGRKTPPPKGPRFVRVAWRVLRIVVICTLVVAAAIVVFEDRFIFFPARFPDGPWDRAPRQLPGLADVEFWTEDGVKLHAWWVPAERARGVVLLCQGNAGNVTHRLDLLGFLREERLSTLALEYRGYGKSDGRPDEQGVYRDGRAAYDELRRRGIPPESIVLWGQSLGSGVAVELAGDAKRPAAACILEAPIPSVPDMCRAVTGWFPVWWLMRSRFDNVGKAPALRLPLLVVHGTEDRVVPLALGRRVYDAAGSPDKSIHEVPGADHMDAWETGGREFRRRLRALLDAHVTAPPDAR